jgi:hypothetical protein
VLQNYKRLAKGDDNRITYLGELSSLEVNKCHENGVRSQIAAAKFPVIQTMESFDFSLQPELPRRSLTEDQHRESFHSFARTEAPYDGGFRIAHRTARSGSKRYPRRDASCPKKSESRSNIGLARKGSL